MRDSFTFLSFFFTELPAHYASRHSIHSTLTPTSDCTFFLLPEGCCGGGGAGWFVMGRGRSGDFYIFCYF